MAMSNDLCQSRVAVPLEAKQCQETLGREKVEGKELFQRFSHLFTLDPDMLVLLLHFFLSSCFK